MRLNNSVNVSIIERLAESGLNVQKSVEEEEASWTLGEWATSCIKYWASQQREDE
jgi:hypothetical protein